ncbi:hypothetical protein CBM2609_B70304 [Cupriavidus taiwanensis]|uniref:hypothetical protein n=1 Tax=Cupriavidus taiwanensis TaxID=164546 RepID=UPI000E14F2D5|nr:hypothetical protein [Cupriavidus taiwanensis]SOZ20138.1 hypothetical protein CBM2604_B60302 [Cupriavidus taiwanensis]SOZ33361.1 hypothetical protein CBM2609_B70304 [Cupriavidus taiwanensis]SOZ48680.1 hypothetical protein CBM2610_B50304 [Cupriavidus taiwanensis]
MEIEFDLAKDAINQRHHGLSLAAAGLMDFDCALMKIDDRKPYGKTVTSHMDRLVHACIAWYSPCAATH